MTKFKALTKKQKIEHIWEYYRLHIIGSIVGIIFLTNILVTIFSPRPPAPAAQIVIVGKLVQDDEKIASLTSEMEHIIGDGEDQRIELSFLPVDWAEYSQLTMGMEQKLMVMLHTKEIDVFGLEKERFASYVESLEESMFEPLDDIPALAKILEQNKENLMKVKFEDQEQEKVYGIFVKDNIKLKKIGLGDDFLITIPIVSENKDNAVKVIQWLYE